MKILFCGDVVGRSGREVVLKHIPELRKQLNLDFIIVNGENSASGFGINKKIYNSYIEASVDVVTTGDHAFDQKDAKPLFDEEKNILRPANFPSQLTGRGAAIYQAANGKKILVIQLLAQVFVKLEVNCPFECVENILKEYRLGQNIDAIFVDFHGEATSERMAMGHFLDGRVSFVSGSHTHVPTADHQILPKGTAYQTDAGMCGDYNSVIGFVQEAIVKNFINKIREEKMKPALGEGTLCGIIADIDDSTGLAKNIAPVRVGGQLEEIIPII